MRKRIFSTTNTFKACEKENELLGKGYRQVNRENNNLSKFEYIIFEHYASKLSEDRSINYEIVWVE